MFQKMKKHIIVALVCVLFFGMLPMTKAEASQNFKNDVKKSVVVVAVAFEDTYGRKITFGYGTGWFVGKQGENPEYLVTNHHVIKTFLDYGRGELVTLQQEDGSKISGRAKVLVFYASNHYEEAYIVQSDDVKDLALLRLNAPTSIKKPLQLLNATDDMVGSTVFVVGYPGIADNIFNSAVSQWGEDGVSVYRGIISRLLTVTGTGCRLIQTDADIQQGDSGGPMVNADGHVIGVNVSYVTGLDSGERVHYAVNIADLIPMLNQNGVAYDMASASTNAGDINTEKLPDVSTPVVDTNENENKDMIMKIAIAAIVMIGVVAIVLIVVKKKPAPEKKVQETPTPVAPVVNVPVKKAVLRSMSPQHNGMSIPLTSGQEIYIGRNMSVCRMVFRDDTPGVSSRHCSLVWNESANSFVLIDLQSTYGTYLANGQRLTPGVSQYLRSGECFYLGDRSNMLRVEVE